jgi:hypothetical protein
MAINLGQIFNKAKQDLGFGTQPQNPQPKQQVQLIPNNQGTNPASQPGQVQQIPDNRGTFAASVPGQAQLIPDNTGTFVSSPASAQPVSVGPLEFHPSVGYHYKAF